MVIALDLFAGSGRGAGLRDTEVREVGVENNQDAVATREANGLVTEVMDVRKLDDGAADGFDILIASPPCQTFSFAGLGDGRAMAGEIGDAAQKLAEGRRASVEHDAGLVLEAFRIALGSTPKIIVFEQVPAVIPIWRMMAGILRQVGYEADAVVLNCGDYGVPQDRRRAFLLASLDGLPAPPAVATPETPTIESVLPGRKGWNLRALRGAGMTARYGGRPPRRSDQPSFTVMAWKDSRMVWEREGEREAPTTEELATLQTYPENFTFCGSPTSQHRQIGNAVPPLMARTLINSFLA